MNNLSGVCVGGPHDGKEIVSAGPLVRVAIMPKISLALYSIEPPIAKYAEYRWDGKEFRYHK